MSTQASDFEQLFATQAPTLREQSPQGEFFLPPAHAQLLDKLEHLSRYSQFVQVVEGVSGAGKTTLLKQFYPSPDDSGVHACCICATVDMGASELLSELVEQLSIDLAVTASDEDKLRAIYQHADLLQDISRLFLVVVDDAERLAEDALDLLLNLLQAIRNPEARPHLVLFATPKLSEQLNTPRFQSVMENSCHFVELEPLDYGSMLTFVQHRFTSVYAGLSEAQLRRLHNESFGLPGRIPKVLNHIFEGPTSVNKKPGQKTAGFPRLHLILAALMVAAIAVSAWVFYPEGPAGEEERMRVELPIPTKPKFERPPSEPTPATTPTLSLKDKLAKAEAELAASMPAAPMAPAEPKLKAPALEIIQLAPAPIKTSPSTSTKAEVVETPAPSAPKKLVLKIPDAEPIAKTAPQASTKKAPNNEVQQEQTLLSWKSTGYTLQMLGARKEKSVIDFIKDGANNDNIYYFSTIYKGKPWYVVVYGQYRNRDQALAAIADLPPKLRERRPWARSVQGVQDDIRRKK